MDKERIKELFGHWSPEELEELAAILEEMAENCSVEVS